MKTYLVVYITSALVALLLTPIVMRVARSLGLVDMPNARKVHRTPITRVGGVAIFAALLATLVPVLALNNLVGQALRDVSGEVLVVLIAAACVFFVGLVDDVRGVPATWKLLALLAGALACCSTGIRIGALGVGTFRVELGWFDWPLTVLWIVGVTVAVNFIDGLDGLAAGICAIAFGTIALLAVSHGQMVMAVMAFGLLGSLSGFLVFNTNPARVFMGDCGSLFLGFTLGACSVVAHAVPGTAAGLLLPAAALAIPILDAACTMVRRGVLQRRSLFAPERGHIHHKLMDLGLSHRHTVMLLHGVTLFSAGMGTWILYAKNTSTAAVLVAVLAISLYCLFRGTKSVHAREMFAALRRNRDMGQRHKTYQEAFEEMQIRFASVDSFPRWWEETRAAAEKFDFAQLSLHLINRDGSPRVLDWSDGRAAAAAQAHANGNGNGNGHAAKNGNGNGHASNGNGNGHPRFSGNGHANGHAHENGNGHAAEDETFNASVPIRERRVGGVVHADVRVRIKGSLESAARRVTLLARLMEEYSIAMLPETPRDPTAVGLWAEPAIDGAADADRQTEGDVVAVPGRISSLPPDLRVAIVHDFLYTYAGAERVLEQMLCVFPQADLFSLFDFLEPKNRAFLRGKVPRTSFIQKLPWARKKHRTYLPLMPLAVEQLDVSAYDLVLSSSYVAAKGIITRPDQLHICYCHSPVRFAWDLQHQYLSEAGLTSGLKSMFARGVLHYIRNWDARSAGGVDIFLTNSDFVGRRIEKFYRRPSTTIYPPVDVEKFDVGPRREDFYLTVSRMVPYKRIGLIVEAFTKMPDKRLIVVGEGPEFERIRAKAGPNVRLVGYQSFERVKAYMQLARAFIFAAEEDFGIVPVEAQACGTPVIAFGRGGVTESVLNGRTGIFFSEQTPESLITAVHEFEGVAEWDPQRIRMNAERFSAARFREQFLTQVEESWTAFRTNKERETEPELWLTADPAVLARRVEACVRRAERRGTGVAGNDADVPSAAQILRLPGTTGPLLADSKPE